MSLSLPSPLLTRLAALAEQRGQSAEQVLGDLIANADADFFETSLEMLCIATTDGQFRRLNRAFCASLGYTEAELLAVPSFTTLVHDDDLSSTFEALAVLRQGQPANHFINRYRCADGSYKWLSWMSMPLPNGLIYAAAHDITREKELEASLKAQAGAVRTILESITDAFFALDSDWRFTYVNAEAEKLLRATAKTLLGIRVWDAFPDAVGSEFYQQYYRVAETGVTATFVAYFDPFATWFEVRAYPADNGISVYFRDVTERLRDEETRRQRTQEFRALVENNPDAIGRINRDMCFVYLNPALRRQLQLGDDAPALIPAQTLNLPPPLVAYLTAVARKVFASGVEQSIQFEVPLGEQVRYFEARVVPEYGPDGAVETILTINHDITVRRQTEQALHESESFFRAMVESQIDMVCRYLPDTTVVYANDAYCRFFGKPRAELLGTTFLPMVVAETYEPIRERIAQVLRDPRPEVRVFKAIAADGSPRYIQWVDHGIVNDQGEVVLIQAVGRDITPLKEAEAALQHKEEQYRQLFENNPIPMWVYDPATLRFLTVNEAAVAQYGYSRDEFFRMRVSDLSVPEDRTRLVRMISQLKPGRSSPVEWRQMRKNGTLMDMEIFGHDIIFESRPARMALARDVTQRNQLEEQRLYTQELEFELAKERELAELRERFMSMVSHEFRTPLTIIATSVSIIERYFDRISRDKVIERMSDINQQIDIMLALLEDVLTILRGNAGKLLFNPENLDIVELCGRVVENTRLIDHSQHVLVFEPEAPALFIEADRRLVQHIVTNLVTNAVKYSPSGTRVRAAIRAIEGGVLLSVEDEGMGIPPEDQPYLFQPFYRARNTTKIEGTGLGLTIVKQNVELHGGNISFHSVENQGTTFIVQLPRVLPAPAETGL